MIVIMVHNNDGATLMRVDIISKFIWTAYIIIMSKIDVCEGQGLQENS